jgi:TRAP-type C4-dicarboxylate transport system permease small subunit
VVAVALQIGSRALAVSMIWTAELTQYLLVWLTFLGMAAVHRSGGHIAVELFVDWLPPRLGRIEKRIIHLLVAVFFLVFSAIAADFVWAIRWSRAATIDISMLWPYLALPVGSALGFLFALELVLTPGISATDRLG